MSFFVKLHKFHAHVVLGVSGDAHANDQGYDEVERWADGDKQIRKVGL